LFLFARHRIIPQGVKLGIQACDVSAGMFDLSP